MSATLPERYLKRVLHEFTRILTTQGKTVLTFELNHGTGGVVNSMKVKRFMEDEERA